MTDNIEQDKQMTRMILTTPLSNALKSLDIDENWIAALLVEAADHDKVRPSDLIRIAELVTSWLGVVKQLDVSMTSDIGTALQQLVDQRTKRLELADDTETPEQIEHNPS